MPATEETFRKQPTLHVVFAATSIAMTLVIVWMVMADHLRPWKQVQRGFHGVETAKLKALEQEKRAARTAKTQAELDRVNKKIAEADAIAARNASEIRAQEVEVDRTRAQFQRAEPAKRFLKAEIDGDRSEYDLLIDRELGSQARDFITKTIKPKEQSYLTLSRELEAIQQKLEGQQRELADLQGNKAEWEKKKEDLEREVSRVGRVIEQKDQQYYGVLAWLRALPGIDMAASPTRIQQISLPDLKINYNFKDVPRYDRCTTCHLGIDRLNYDKAADGKPMPAVYKSHPHLADGYVTTDPTGKKVPAGLYLDSNGPHPINSYGCTICHGGQGSGTDFTYASHEPNDLEEKERWEKEHGWREMHHWDEPMLPTRFQEASCVKCHHQVTDVPQAEKLQKGYDRIVKYGCTGCHTIGGPGSFGPDLSDARQVGPNLRHIASKVTRDWTLKWIKNPHAFRPDTRMPRFYNLTNNHAPEDQPKSHAEIHAITHYLFKHSTPPKEFEEVKAKGDQARGKELFFQKGCMACHAHKEFPPDSYTKKDDKGAPVINGLGLAEGVGEFAKANFGPNLSNMKIKFQTEGEGSHAKGVQWLANWIKAPENYHRYSLMPNLQLSWQDSADLAEWIMSVPGEWPGKDYEVPDVNSDEVKKGLDELVRLYLSKAGSFNGKTVLLSGVDQFVAGEMTQDQKLEFLGERTIGRLGCFGCHNIPGFEQAKPIGTPLNGWGVKSPAKLDFGHIHEYLVDQTEAKDSGFDLRLVPSGDEKDGLPAEGKNLIVVADVRKALHFRVFDGVGKIVEDADENQLTAKASQMAGLKSLLGGLWKVPRLSPSDKSRVIDAVTSIVGHTRVDRSRDGTPDYYQEKLVEHTRSGFLFQKLHRPRSYDYKKTKEELKGWDERLRMPQFAWADDPAAVEEVMTLVLGLTGEKIDSKYLPHYGQTKAALAQGEKLLDRFNCKGCHVLAMPKYTAKEGVALADALPALKNNLAASSGDQGRGNDYLKELYPALDVPKDELDTLLGKLKLDKKTIQAIGELPRQSAEDWDEKGKPIKAVVVQVYEDPITIAGESFVAGDSVLISPDNPDLKVRKFEQKGAVTIEGMPIDVEEDDDGQPTRQLVQLWKPTTIRGYTFNAYDNILVRLDKVDVKRPEGGDFAWLYATAQAEKSGAKFADVWNRLPPPLIREGLKVQTPWLTRFLKDPYPIRPAANLRMPRFHWDLPKQDETGALANYFPARDDAPFPYQDIPQREQNYLSARDASHADYLSDGWKIMAKEGSACLSCHAIGANVPGGGAGQVNGPNLRQVSDRFRSAYLLEWLARPQRLVPYSVMPQNVPPHGAIAVHVPKSFEGKPFELVEAMRDTLLNYVTAAEGQLAAGKPEDKPSGVEKKGEPAPAQEKDKDKDAD